MEYNKNRQMKYFDVVCREKGSYPEVVQAVWIGAFMMGKIAVNGIKKQRLWRC